MTKEELVNEANEYADTKVKDRKGYNARWELVRNAYLASAEPREKQIDELKAQTKVLEQNLEDTEICENGLKNRIVDLEAQIEKMKCGQNCKHSYLYQEDRKCKFTYCDCINCKDKWESRR